MKKVFWLILFPLLLTSCMWSKDVVSDTVESQTVTESQEITDTSNEVKVIENTETEAEKIHTWETEKIIQETEKSLSEEKIQETIVSVESTGSTESDPLFDEVFNEINEIIQLSEEDE